MEEASDRLMRKLQARRTGARLASITVWWLLFITLGTLTGMWIKLFWIAWVFAK